MSKPSVNDYFRRGSKSPVLGWDAAILDAQHLAAEAESKAARLRKAVEAFKLLRDNGEPWPGTFESESELLGQK